MTRLLLIDDDPARVKKVTACLRRIDDSPYLLQVVNPKQFSVGQQADFDLLLIGDGASHEMTAQLLNQSLKRGFSYPVVYLCHQYDLALEQRLLARGVDECVVSEQLTPLLLHRVLQHAILRKRMMTELALLSTHDRQTGLANRYLFQQHLQHAVSLAQRKGSRFAVICLDLDKFKLVNDSLGVDFGDMLLMQVAQRLQQSLRGADVVARLGNDEFAILLEDYQTSHDLPCIVNKIQQQLDAPFLLQGQELYISASLGVASFPECGHQAERLLKAAESALYTAKTLGRNQCHFFRGDLNRQARVKLELEKNLRRALINGEFEIYLQPKIRLHDWRLVGAEALLRWRHPQRGLIAPNVFIPMLEDMGMIAGVEAWVLRESCFLARSLNQNFGTMRISVNISGAHFRTGNLKENVYLALQASSLDAESLEVELTEDIMIDHVEGNRRLLGELKELGISVALDDFGKGYSSLSYLKNFPADVLKVDKAFIDHIASNTRDAAIVEGLIRMAHQLGIEVVAEGVEAEVQLARLIEMGCDQVQGFYFSKPIDIVQFQRFAGRHFRQFKAVVPH